MVSSTASHQEGSWFETSCWTGALLSGVCMFPHHMLGLKDISLSDQYRDMKIQDVNNQISKISMV